MIIILSLSNSTSLTIIFDFDKELEKIKYYRQDLGDLVLPNFKVS